MAWYLVFWRNRSTATVVPAASASQARSRAQRQTKAGLWGDRGRPPSQSPGQPAYCRGVWVRRRRDGTSPQFGSARSKARARRQRSAYRHWL